MRYLTRRVAVLPAACRAAAPGTGIARRGRGRGRGRGRASAHSSADKKQVYFEYAKNAWEREQVGRRACCLAFEYGAIGLDPRLATPGKQHGWVRGGGRGGVRAVCCVLTQHNPAAPGSAAGTLA